MADSRRFVFVHRSDRSYGSSQTKSGIYATMKFVYGGQKRTPFPLNIELDTTEDAIKLLQLLQPVADNHAETAPFQLVDDLAKSDTWQEVCHFMDNLSEVFYAVGLGKRVGIFINQDGACASLADASSDKWRKCERFSSFHGAFVAMATCDQIYTDYIGPGIGSANEDLSNIPPQDSKHRPSVLPTTPRRSTRATAEHDSTFQPSAAPATAGRTGHSSPGPSGKRFSAHPQTPTRPATAHQVVAPAPHGPSFGSFGGQSIASHASPSRVAPSPGISVHVSPFVGIQVQGTSHLRRQAKAPMSPSPARGDGTMSIGTHSDREWLVLYVATHNFNDSAVDILEAYFNQSGSEEEFVAIVARSRELNITRGQAVFLFRLMEGNPE
ncbi:hypothetical protein FPV67DRAFT_1653544 [Lyophyllum atratum]|nr:hypothetical protein FPV67DRAFT_1653544 [Lyophyllum atratum]